MGCVVIKYGKDIFPPLFVSKIATYMSMVISSRKSWMRCFQDIHSMIDVESVLPYNSVDIQQQSGVIHV